MKNNIIITVFILLSSLSYADEWPDGAKLSYIDNCTNSVSSQGLPISKAKPYCTCIAGGMEEEFGLSEYKQMMNAQPNPKGDSYDRRLFNILNSCKTKLSR
jgi:hypothetical protein